MAAPVADRAAGTAGVLAPQLMVIDCCPPGIGEVDFTGASTTTWGGGVNDASEVVLAVVEAS